MHSIGQTMTAFFTPRAKGKEMGKGMWKEDSLRKVGRTDARTDARTHGRTDTQAILYFV